MALYFRCTCGWAQEAPEDEIGLWLVCPECGREAAVSGSPIEPPTDIAEPREPTPAPRPDEAAEIVAPVAAVPSRDWRRRAEEYERECQEAAERFTAWHAFRESMVFPLRGSAALTTFLLAIPVGLLLFVGVVLWCVGLPMLVVGAAFGFGWLMVLIRAAAAGPDETPTWACLDFVQDRVWPAMKMVANFAVVAVFPAVAVVWLLGFLGLGASGETGRSAAKVVGLLVFLASLLVYYGMSFTIVAIHDRSFLASINPVLVLRSIRRIWGEYAGVLFFSAMLVALAAGTVRILTWGPEWLDLLRRLAPGLPPFVFGVVEAMVPLLPLLTPFVPYYLLCVIASRLGFMVYRNRHRLGWIPSPVGRSFRGVRVYNG